MKKNILKITFAAALAVGAGVTAYQAQNKEMMSDLALVNVEALARDENTGGDHGMKRPLKKVIWLLHTNCIYLNSICIRKCPVVNILRINIVLVLRWMFVLNSIGDFVKNIYIERMIRL